MNSARASVAVSRRTARKRKVGRSSRPRPVALAFAGLAIADAAQLNVTRSGSTPATSHGAPTAHRGDDRHGTPRREHRCGEPLRGARRVRRASRQRGPLPEQRQLRRRRERARPSTGSFDIATTSYHTGNISGVALLIGTWGVPATWSAAPVVLAARLLHRAHPLDRRVAPAETPTARRRAIPARRRSPTTRSGVRRSIHFNFR